MRSKSFRNIIRAAIAAGVIATCSASQAAASWKDAIMAIPTSCVLHDLDWDYSPIKPAIDVDRLSNHHEEVIPDDPWTEMKCLIEDHLCQSHAKQFAMRSTIHDLFQRVAIESQSWIENSAEWMHRYNRWHDAWIATLRDPGPSIAELVASLQASEDASTSDTTDAIASSAIVYETSDAIALDADAISSSVDECNDWDCSEQYRPAGTLASGNKANIFVFRLNVPNRDSMDRIPSVNVDLPAATALQKLNAWQVGVDPICPEIQRPASPWSAHKFGMPYSCIFESDSYPAPSFLAQSQLDQAPLDMSDHALEFRPKLIDGVLDSDTIEQVAIKSHGEPVSPSDFDYGVGHCATAKEFLPVPYTWHAMRPFAFWPTTSDLREQNLRRFETWIQQNRSSVDWVLSTKHRIWAPIGQGVWQAGMQTAQHAKPWIDLAAASSLHFAEHSARQTQPFEGRTLQDLLTTVYHTDFGPVVMPLTQRFVSTNAAIEDEASYGYPAVALNRSNYGTSDASRIIAKNLRSVGTLLIDLAKSMDGQIEGTEVAGRDSNQR